MTTKRKFGGISTSMTCWQTVEKDSQGRLWTNIYAKGDSLPPSEYEDAKQQISKQKLPKTEFRILP